MLIYLLCARLLNAYVSCNFNHSIIRTWKNKQNSHPSFDQFIHMLLIYKTSSSIPMQQVTALNLYIVHVFIQIILLMWFNRPCLHLLFTILLSYFLILLFLQLLCIRYKPSNVALRRPLNFLTNLLNIVYPLLYRFNTASLISQCMVGVMSKL